MRYLGPLLVISLLNILAGSAITRWFRPYRFLLIEEDALVENLTAVFFLLAFALALFFSLRIRPRRMHRGLATLALVALVGFLDEISFGERLFNLSMPAWGGVQLDAVHDLVELAYKNIPLPAILITAGVLAPLAAVLVVRRLSKQAKETSLWSALANPSLCFVALFSLFIAAAVLIDLHLFRSRLLFSLEEVFELNAALTLFFFSFSLYESASDGMASPRRTKEKRGHRSAEKPPCSPATRPQGTDTSSV